MQTNPTPKTILGFTRDEWKQARFDDPVAATEFQEFLDVVTSAQGGLAGIGPEAVLALARVSPAFARRLGDYYRTVDPLWRTNMRKYLELNFGPDGTRAELVRSQWTAILALLDASDSDS